MKKYEHESLKQCALNFWVFLWFWAFVCGIGCMLVSAFLCITLEMKMEPGELAFFILKWSYGSGVCSFFLLLVFIWVRSLIRLSRYKKQAVVYAEEKELKEFISHCKQKKGLR